MHVWLPHRGHFEKLIEDFLLLDTRQVLVFFLATKDVNSITSER